MIFPSENFRAVVPRPSRLIGPVAESGDHFEIVVEIFSDERAIGLAEGAQAVLLRFIAAGEQHVIDFIFFEFGNDGGFLWRGNFNVFEENQLPRRRFPVGQIIIETIVRQREESLVGFERFGEKGRRVVDGFDPGRRVADKYFGFRMGKIMLRDFDGLQQL